MLMTPDNGPATTAGVIALGNLAARIDAQAWQATRGRLTVGERAELVELIALRGHVLGRITDAERAAALAEQLVRQVPGDARSFVARARMAAVFHRFAPALTDLDAAAALGGDRVTLDEERAAIYQALGRYDEALAIRRRALERHADFSALGALAGIYAERGEMGEADRWFMAARGGWSTTISTVPAPAAMRRSAGCRPTSPRRATWPKSTRPCVSGRLPLRACARWRWHPKIPITRPSSPAS